MKRALAFTGGLLVLSTLFVQMTGCSEDKPVANNTTPTDDAGTVDTGPEAILPLGEPRLCADAEADIYTDPGALTPFTPDQRGVVLRCAKSPELTKEALQAELTRTGYTGKAVSSGARVYKILYRTSRGDAAASPSYTSAIVYVPTTQRAEKMPIVVAARGSRGQAGRCAVSKADPALAGINDDAIRMNYALVGHGYAVIVPDLAGYANFGVAGNPPSAYAQAADVGRSTLDGSRALKQLYPQLDDKTVLVGHSQGGHSALSALALADTYGAQGSIAGVAVYAPLWLSQRTWGAILDAPVAIDRGYTLTALAGPSAISVWYHYTQAELLDGAGEGLKLFKPEKQPVIKKFIDESCWGEYTELQANNDPKANYAYELFVDAFPASIGAVASGLKAACTAGDTVCEKWLARYTNDRPHLTGTAASTPILMMYGGKDTTIEPSRMACALERLRGDLGGGATGEALPASSPLKVCYEAEATHGSIIDVRSEYVADWIASVALGGTAPAACAANETSMTATCASPPPND